MTNNKDEISKAASHLGKLSHKKSPRSKEYYQELNRKSVESRRRAKGVCIKCGKVEINTKEAICTKCLTYVRK